MTSSTRLSAAALLATVLCASLSAAEEKAPTPLRLGDQIAPLPTTDALTGKAVTHGAGWSVVEFFATWCPSCRRSLADTTKVLEERAAAAEVSPVRLIVVDVGETPETLRDWFRAHPLYANTLVIADPKQTLFHAWGANRLPTTFVIDAQGIVRHINRGHGPGFQQRLARWLKQR